MPKLSIITINLNNRDGLLKTIQSVVSQSFTDYEWIVIDGGSTDGSRDIIEQYSSRFAYWVSEPDKGIYNAMNKGIDKANGDWIQFLNSGDCLHDKDTLQQVFALNLNADIIYGDYIRQYGTQLTETIQNTSIRASNFLSTNLCQQSMFYSNKTLKNNPFDESFSIIGDWAKNMSLLFQNYKYQHINIFISIFDGTGITFTETDTVYKEKEIMFEKYIPDYLREDMKVLKKNKFIQSRKSFILLDNLNYRLCTLLDKILHHIEVTRRKITSRARNNK